MKTLEKVSRWLDRICKHLILYLLMWMTVVSSLQIAVRTLFNSGITWSEEMARYAMVWMIFLGAAVAAREGSQIRVSVLEDSFPAIRKWLTPIQHLLSLFYLLVIIWVSWSVLPIVNTQTSANMGIPMSTVYISIPVAAVIMLIHILILFFRNKPGHDEGEMEQ